SLSDEDKEYVQRAGRQATYASRGAVRSAEAAALATLAANGVEIYFPSAEEKATFKDASQQPAIDYLYENFDRALIDEMLELVDSYAAQ
ncbi:MAG: hypothetical protein Q4D04_09615, partial [Clostridia bacterium]|nr:hypothetical protein [Clostridia bacterium]